MSMVLARAVPSEVAETSLTSKVSESGMKIIWPYTWGDVTPPATRNIKVLIACLLFLALWRTGTLYDSIWQVRKPEDLQDPSMTSLVLCQGRVGLSSPGRLILLTPWWRIIAPSARYSGVLGPPLLIFRAQAQLQVRRTFSKTPK